MNLGDVLPSRRQGIRGEKTGRMATKKVKSGRNRSLIGKNAGTFIYEIIELEAKVYNPLMFSIDSYSKQVVQH